MVYNSDDEAISKPLAMRGDRGAARPGSAVERQLLDLRHFERLRPMPADTLTDATGHAIPLQCRGFADTWTLRRVENRWPRKKYGSSPFCVGSGFLP